jgi:uncharacterized protein YdaU (DUF1376 family)
VPVDLRDFPFMPLYTDRLQRSKAWLLCKRDPSLAFYMMNLWMRSWHELPCGSVEDDDDVLADAAMCDLKTWLKVKDRVLRGWERRDGRIYHSVVTEIAQASWDKKQAQRQRTEAARQVRAQLRDSDVTQTVTRSVTDVVTETEEMPSTEDVTTSVTENVTGAVTTSVTENVTEDVTASKGQYKGEEERKTPPKPPPKRGRRQRLPVCPIPVDWWPDEKGYAYAASKNARSDAAAVQGFRNWHQAHGTVRADWPASWRQWCDHSEEFGRSNPGPPNGQHENVNPLIARTFRL